MQSSEVAIVFPVLCFFVGTLVTSQVFQATKIPYTVILFSVGLGIGALDHACGKALGVLGQSVHLWSNISSSLLLYGFLPGLLFESAFFLEVHQVKRCLMQIVLLAGPGVVISTACLGTVHYFLFPYGWTLNISLLLGSLLSATDPVAVIALMKEIGTSKKLSTLVEGESTMNDGVAMVIFQLCTRLALGHHFAVGEIFSFFFRAAFGAVLLGITFGVLSALLTRTILKNSVTEITLALALCYSVFFVAQHVAGISGIISVMSFGISFSALSRTAFKGNKQRSMHHFWTMVSHLLNTVIFILSGVIIMEDILTNQSFIRGRDWGYLLLLYLSLQLSRAVIVTLLYPALQYFGYGLALNEAIAVVWSGLRGAVSLALALAIKEDERFSRVIRAKFMFFTGGVVSLTLIVNGSLAQFILELLRVVGNTVSKGFLEDVKLAVEKKAIQATEDADVHDGLDPIDWSQRVRSLDLEVQQEAALSLRVEGGGTSSVQEMRVRFLNCLRATYWKMSEESQVTELAANFLLLSVDQALDATHECLKDWSFLGSFDRLHEAKSTLLHKCYVKRQEWGCEIASGFISAHSTVRLLLRKFVHTYCSDEMMEMAEIVIGESERQVAEAHRFLDNMRLTFPQLLHRLKAKHVVKKILLEVRGDIQCLEGSGTLLEEESKQLKKLTSKI